VTTGQRSVSRPTNDALGDCSPEVLIVST
jgi:hypothetical protein